MKLAIIRQKYNPFGGAERFVERALQALDRDDVELTLITRAWPAQAGGSGRLQHLICDPFYLGSRWRDAGFSRAACAAVAAGDFDLVQAHEKVPCCDIYRAGDGVHRAWLARRARVQSAAGRTGVTLSAFHRHTLNAEAGVFNSPRLKAAICISRMVRADIQNYFDLPDERLPIIYNGIDHAVYQPGVKAGRTALRARYGIPDEVPLFLFLGSGFERKGLAAAIRALPTDAWLLVVGKDKRCAALADLAQRLGCGSRVVFAGGQADPLPYYGAADAFVFPTLYEPFGNVVLEAMACGLPVITTPDCGAGELISEGHSGFIVDALADEELRARMEILSDPGYAKTMGAAAVQAVAAYSLEAMAAQMAGLYRSLLESREKISS